MADRRCGTCRWWQAVETARGWCNVPLPEWVRTEGTGLGLMWDNDGKRCATWAESDKQVSR